MFGKLDEPEMIENYAQPVNESITVGKYTIVNQAMYRLIRIYKEADSGLDDDIEAIIVKESDLEAVIEKFYNENF